MQNDNNLLPQQRAVWLWWVLGGLSLLCLLLQTQGLHRLAIWHSSAILDGQWWRLITGHFTHSNAAHLLMNIASLWLISLLFRPTALLLMALSLSISLLIGVGLLVTDIRHYVGLSGVLHALFAFFALAEWRANKAQGGWLLALLVAKLWLEQHDGNPMEMNALIAASVATQAHLLGALVGGLVGLACVAYRRFTAAPC